MKSLADERMKIEKKSLADEIMEIEKKNPVDNEQRRQDIIEVFEKWGTKYPLVRSVIKHETTFYAEVKKIDQKVGGAKVLFPHYVPDAYTRQRYELSDVVGNVPADNLSNLFFNPVSIGVLGGLAILATYIALEDLPLE